jgi:integrase
MLTHTALRKIKAGEMRHKLYDSGGLLLIVNPNGSLWWRLKYRFGGKERGISLRVYPEVTLKRAREKRDEARQMLSDGLDPSKKRRSDKLSAGITFELVAREWLALHAGKFSPATMAKARWMLETFVYPKLGAQAITSISAPELLSVVREIEARGLHETAKRTKQRVGQVLRYAIATGRAERDVSADLRGALVSFTSKNHAAVTEPSRVGELLRAIDGFTGQATTCAALRLAPLVFVRPGELRAAERAEFDLDADEPLWRIPASRMKMKETHLVPLSRQAAAILRNLRGLTGSARFIFPAIGRKERPISENTMNAALRRLGYGHDEMTSHGFRTIASTLLNERGFAPDLIELQLAHKERNAVRAAYNKAKRLTERRAMMQSWADYFDALKASRPKPAGAALAA